MKFYNRVVDIDGNVPSEQECVICLSFSYEPVACDKCDTAIICKPCYDKIPIKSVE